MFDIDLFAGPDDPEPEYRTPWNPEVFVGDDGLVHIRYAGAELAFERHRVGELIRQLKAIEES